ncbi:MAG: transporter substrate-binding domain-containing protein, partial [Desulfobacterales bacterium]|nr:transporter substrate-binding domain-containing protein [Desulfobacterales bacterium]
MITPNPFFSLARAFLGMTVMALSLVAGPNSDAKESEFLQEIQTERGSDRIEVPPNRRGTNSGETVEDRRIDRDGPFRKVRVGLYNNKPKIFVNEAGRPSGIFVDLLDWIARKEKWELIYVPCSWPECIQGLKAGRIDLMPDVAYSMEREDEFAFHDEPVIESWSQVYSNRKAGVAKLSDLNGLRIALLDGSIQQKILQNTIIGFGYQATFVSASSFEEAFRLTADGAADAVATNHLFGDYYFEEYGLVKTPIAFNPTSLYFAAANGRNPDLLEALDRNLRAMKSAPKSIYYQTLGRWMERPQPPVTVLPRHLIWVMGGIGGFLILTIIAALMLRMQVRAQTRHLVQANELLKESEEKYTALYETSRDGIALLNTEGNFRQANRAFLEMTGYEMREIEGLNCHKLTPEKWRDKERCILE